MWSNPPVVLYHGTFSDAANNILTGVNLAHSRNFLDFGPGFYTTTNLRQARFWSRLKAERFGQAPVVVRFMVSRDMLAALDVLAFVRGDPLAEDFWSFVYHCRYDSPGRNRWAMGESGQSCGTMLYTDQ